MSSKDGRNRDWIYLFAHRHLHTCSRAPWLARKVERLQEADAIQALLSNVDEDDSSAVERAIAQAQELERKNEEEWRRRRNASIQRDFEKIEAEQGPEALEHFQKGMLDAFDRMTDLIKPKPDVPVDPSKLQ